MATDASGLYLVPESVARPADQLEVLEILQRCSRDCVPITTAGGQTSTTGASITDRGVLLSMRGMDRRIDFDPLARMLRVEAGAYLGDVAGIALDQGLMLAPDPTSEVECTVGGAVACNASGARTLMYGPTRNHVRALKVALINGEILELRRSALEKNVVGYKPVHDLIDWFIGSEGTLGVVLEVEFALMPAPTRVVGFSIPFADETSALQFIVEARHSTLQPRCLEYFDPVASAIFRARSEELAPPVVYTEEASATDQVDFDAWLELAERHNAQVDDIEVYDDPVSLREARRRRHLIPSAMNERSARARQTGGRKVSTDWAVPFQKLPATVAIARRIATQHNLPQPVTFGHAGNGHPHQNWIGQSPDEVGRAERAVSEILQHVVAYGGTVAAEHGIGKIKRRWVPLQLNSLQQRVMRAVKRELDPNGLLAPGNLFDPAPEN